MVNKIGRGDYVIKRAAYVTPLVQVGGVSHAVAILNQLQPRCVTRLNVQDKIKEKYAKYGSVPWKVLEVLHKLI